MELKEFIKIAIQDITGAVSELQSELNNGSVVNPSLVRGDIHTTIMINNEVKPIERLNFDVAVSIADSSSLEGKAKAGISILGGGLGGATISKSENISRLTFSIPIIYPTVDVANSPRIPRPRYPED